MELRHIPIRLEIQFWSIAIYLMGQSPLVQKAIQYGYRARENYQSVHSLAKAAVWASLGLLLGLLLGFMTA